MTKYLSMSNKTVKNIIKMSIKKNPGQNQQLKKIQIESNKN